MRLTLASLALPLLPLSLAATAADWAKRASSSSDGIIQLSSPAEYDDLISSDRDYGVTVVLSALPASFKCQPCQEFDPVYRSIANSWRKNAPNDQRDDHFFALLDFPNGQSIYQRLGLTSAPNVYYHPPATGPRKSDQKMINFDLNRYGLSPQALHAWVKSTTPVPFELYQPINYASFILVPAILGFLGYAAWSGRALLIPIATSRLVWGAVCIFTCILFTSGFMWNKIKNAPYVQPGPNGQISWVAGGYSNQFGLETQVVGAMYGVLALAVIVLSVFIPAQSSPIKQRVGTILWLSLLIVIYSMLIRLFKLKNGGYPFQLL